MTPETLAALQGSIVKWENIVAGTGADEGSGNCPLCQLYAATEEIDSRKWCTGCPVKDKTGEPSCNGTPYYSANIYLKDPAKFDDIDRKNAQAELDFLRSLLPRWEWGFDTTMFNSDGWRNVCSRLGLVFIRREPDHHNEWIWSTGGYGLDGDVLVIYTTANPHTGEYHKPAQRDPELDFAGYIGIEGRPFDVKRAVELIREFALTIKGESPYKRSYI